MTELGRDPPGVDDGDEAAVGFRPLVGAAGGGARRGAAGGAAGVSINFKLYHISLHPWTRRGSRLRKKDAIFTNLKVPILLDHS